MPVLERPPAIGVIECDEDDTQEDATAKAVLMGVLDSFDTRGGNRRL
ncbi:hypothetical protein ACIHAX_11865 [Nocardia sp. NPDC051929]